MDRVAREKELSCRGQVLQAGRLPKPPSEGICSAHLTGSTGPVGRYATDSFWTDLGERDRIATEATAAEPGGPSIAFAVDEMSIRPITVSRCLPRLRRRRSTTER